MSLPFRALLAIMLIATSSISLMAAEEPRETIEVVGWTLHIHPQLREAKHAAKTDRALEILRTQLTEIVEILPSADVAKLRQVPLFFSPPYPGETPNAAYHPNIDWLRKNGRDPLMARSVEFTNIEIFEKEWDRMPNFVLHELSHAWHDRFLPMGYANPEVKRAFEDAKMSGRYAKVERRHGGDRPNTFGVAYAMNNPMEYFAECSEAFFGTNDFFPFDRAELKKHDPEMFALLGKLWRLPDAR
ncbi:MAG: hypothetical protein KDN19_11275 [Verrucomicrobiae bacterium]|nr:hypothetical protein [Verrucomicrobiae bacterium]